LRINRFVFILSTFQAVHRATSASANKQFLLAENGFLAQGAVWRIIHAFGFDIAFGVIVHAQPQEPFALGGAAIALSERCFE
jgi:hypothetical protein